MADVERAGGPRGAEALAVAAILLVAAALHAAALPRPFFADDYLFLEQVRGRSLFAALASPDPIGNFFRPVSRALWFWLLAHAGGERPIVFHAASLGVFGAALLAFHALARRVVGRAGALVALAFLALHQAADVPLLWASGSQDLLALLFASLALLLHVAGRRAWAVLALALALLSKESVAGAALVAIALDHSPGERWRASVRRGAGLLGVTATWAIAWGATSSARPAATHVLAARADGAAAAFVHLAQVALGAEFRLGGNALGHWRAWALVPALEASAIVALAARGMGATGRGARGAGARAALVWIATALVPLALVMPIWSDYFYLWALAGVALLLGAWTCAWAPPARAALVGALVLLAGEARGLDEFAAGGGAWAWQPHVDARYVERSLDTIARGLAQLRVARPVLAPRTTVFFADVPPASGWQAGNGPLLRWAYRDSTLRSYFLGDFTRERASRGPALFFAFAGDSLVDRSADPQLLPSFAYSMLLAEHPRAAIDALDLALARGGAPGLAYWRALASLAAGDTTAAMADLRRCGFAPARALPPGAGLGVAATGADTTARLAALERLRAAAALAPWPHARLAALLPARGRPIDGAIEAYAYRTLAADDPDAWRKWSAAQLAAGASAPALVSLERYLALAGAAGRTDAEAQRAATQLRRLVRGDLAQRALRAGVPR